MNDQFWDNVAQAVGRYLVWIKALYGPWGGSRPNALYPTDGAFGCFIGAEGQIGTPMVIGVGYTTRWSAIRQSRPRRPIASILER